MTPQDRKEVRARVVAGNIHQDFLDAQPNTPVMTTWGNTLTCLLVVGDRDTCDMRSDEYDSHCILMRDAENKIWDVLMQWMKEYGFEKVDRGNQPTVSIPSKYRNAIGELLQAELVVARQTEESPDLNVAPESSTMQRCESLKPEKQEASSPEKKKGCFFRWFERIASLLKRRAT